MSDFLDTMAEGSRQRFEEAARRESLQQLSERLLSGPEPRPLGRFGEIFDLIAELKPRSPSEGRFPERDPETAVAGYEAGGAAMLSVLTEPSSFGGSWDNLRRVAGRATVPVMAKDFFVDPYQVYQARQAGADGVLVIARILSDATLAEMIEVADALHMFTLLEAFDRDDIIRMSTAAVGFDNVLFGVNCRDLDTLEIVPARHQEVADLLPNGRVCVAESAMGSQGDVERAASLGYRGVLVGSALMRSETAPDLVKAMIDAGRRVAVTV
jgi:indole-3-glycerol phosphate synthase